MSKKSATVFGAFAVFAVLCVVIYVLVSAGWNKPEADTQGKAAVAQGDTGKAAVTGAGGAPESKPILAEEPKPILIEEPKPLLVAGPPAPAPVGPPAGADEFGPPAPPSAPGTAPVALVPGTAKAEEAATQFASYTVKPGDTLWTIAVLELGNGKRWPELVTANQSLSGDEKNLEVGAVLRIPRTAAAEAVTTEAPAPESTAPQEHLAHVVREGDTPAKLAETYYGDSSMQVWMEILAANPGLDPEAMPIGKSIRIPALPGKRPQAPPAAPAPEPPPAAPSPSPTPAPTTSP
jgi:nucleoid-associated protein YgaU